MRRCYEIGGIKASVERTSSGWYEVKVRVPESEIEYRYMFSNKAEALEEIVSYSEISEDDFEFDE